jgi:hypothetical protein
MQLAAQRSYKGVPGRLSTFTNLLETNMYPAQQTACTLQNCMLWVGASAPAGTQQWQWTAGPESGASIPTSAGATSLPGGVQPYTDWCTGFPSAPSSSSAAGLVINAALQLNSICWQSQAVATLAAGYLVEYGSTVVGTCLFHAVGI